MSKPGKNAAKANAGKTNGGNGKSNGHDAKAGPPEPDPVKTYHEGEPFPGRIGRTWDVSEPAFPVPREAPPGAPNILYIVLDDVGFGWADTFGGLVETPNITRLAKGVSPTSTPHDGALLADACLSADRPQPPLGRHGQHHRAGQRLPGPIRVPEHAAPNTMNRSWSADAEVEIPAGGAEGPILVMGGDTNGWSLYLKVGKPTFCYNLGAVQLTYIRAEEVVEPGKHIIRYEFEKRGTEKFGAGGVGRLFVDGDKVAEGEIPRTSAFGYSLDETFDVGCDKGAPVTDEYPALAAFTGKIIKVDIDLKPDLTIDADRHHDEKVKSALLRQ